MRVDPTYTNLKPQSIMYPIHFGADSDTPFSVALHRNQVYSRAFLDLFGWGGGAIIFARNTYERIEKALDLGCWWLIGLCAPIFLDKVVNRRYAAGLRKDFHLPKPTTPKSTPLSLPFEWLDNAGVAQRIQQLEKNPKAVAALKDYGLRSFHDLANSELRSKILNGKLMLLLIDLLLMASKGQIYYWGKNAFTQYLSGKSGFSGEFKDASDAYLKYKSARFEKTKKLRAIASVVIGYGGAIALPLIMWRLLKNQTPAGRGLTGKLKSLISEFNYVDVVFMSKAVLLWHNIFNWNLPALLSARDSHELRESFIKTSLVDFFFFAGDAIMAGWGARYLQRKVHGLETPLLKAASKTGWRQFIPNAVLNYLPEAVPLQAVYKQTGKNSMAYKWAARNMWTTLAVNALILSVLTPLLNNWFTRQKVLHEQKTLHLDKVPTQPPIAFNPIPYSVKPPPVYLPLPLPYGFNTSYWPQSYAASPWRPPYPAYVANYYGFQQKYSA